MKINWPKPLLGKARRMWNIKRTIKMYFSSSMHSLWQTNCFHEEIDRKKCKAKEGGCDVQDGTKMKRYIQPCLLEMGNYFRQTLHYYQEARKVLKNGWYTKDYSFFYSLQGSVRIQKDKIGYFGFYFASTYYVQVRPTWKYLQCTNIFKVCYNQRSAISSKTKLFLFTRILWNL